MHALRRQHQIAEDRLQREVLARQAAEQELLHSKRAQESADEAAQKARLYSSVRGPLSSWQRAVLQCSASAAMVWLHAQVERN